jgi:ABC-type phosphate transport system substrate-binding protein
MKTMLTLALALVVVLADGSARLGHASSPPAYAVVVNRANSTASLSRVEVARLFLKTVTSWPDGGPVAAVDQARTAPVRRVFSVDVHQKDPDAVAAHWQVQVFSGRDVPPRVLRSDADVLAFVRSNPGAIGYVSASTPLDEGVRKLKVE